jgi:hypothetical protein
MKILGMRNYAAGKGLSVPLLPSLPKALNMQLKLLMVNIPPSIPPTIPPSIPSEVAPPPPESIFHPGSLSQCSTTENQAMPHLFNSSLSGHLFYVAPAAKPQVFSNSSSCPYPTHPDPLHTTAVHNVPSSAATSVAVTIVPVWGIDKECVVYSGRLYLNLNGSNWHGACGTSCSRGSTQDRKYTKNCQWTFV